MPKKTKGQCRLKVAVALIKNYVDIDTKLDKVNDECGVFGIYRNDDDIDVVAAAK